MVAQAGSLVLRADLRVGDRDLVGHTIDLSEEGAVIQIDEDAPLGSRIAVKLSLSGLLEQPCSFEAHLVGRRLAAGPGSPATWELAWVHAGGDDRERLLTLLEHLDDSLAHGGSPLRILLVEDSAMTRQVFELGITRLLRHRVGTVMLDCAADGEDALEKLCESDYEVVIVDCLLPGIQGPELIHKLRAELELDRVAVVAMSVGGEEVRRSALAAGADMFVHKPVMVTDLLATLERLGRARHRV